MEEEPDEDDKKERGQASEKPMKAMTVENGDQRDGVTMEEVIRLKEVIPEGRASAWVSVPSVTNEQV